MNIIENFINGIKSITMENIIDVLISLIVVILFFMVSRFISYLIIKIFNFKVKDKKKIKANAFYKPISTFIRITGIYIAIMLLNVSDAAKVNIIKLYKILTIICFANGLANSFHPKSIIFDKLEEKTNYSGDKQLNSFISKLIKAVVYVIAGYLVLLELGYNIGGLVTGLGISSVIIAFAAQDIAKNLFGGFAIITDKPFKVGDWIEVGNYSGTVVDMTYRSTKIKAVDNTIITINNSTIAESYVKNWGNIDRRRYSVTLNLPLHTSEEKINKLLNKIRFVLKTNPDILEDTLEVHFDNIDTEGIKLFIYMNTSKTEYTEYLVFKDTINLELIKILESENVKLAYPGKNIYINAIDEIKNTENMEKLEKDAKKEVKALNEKNK